MDVLGCPQSYSWSKPAGWTSAEPVMYLNFETTDCLNLEQGTKQLTTGHVSYNVIAIANSLSSCSKAD